MACSCRKLKKMYYTRITLNPHVYLDTVLLVGSIATRFEGAEVAFWAGAVTASFVFFFSLGYWF